MITAEEKVNRYGYHYTYYHCTRHKGGIKNRCGQSYIRLEEIERQISMFLEKLYLPQSIVNWALKQLALSQSDEEKLQAEVKKSLVNALNDCKRKIDALLHLKLKELLSDEEYVYEKSKLVEKKMKIEREIARIETGSQAWLESSKKLFSFLTLAKDCFENGDNAIKRQIVAAVSSNLLLKDKILLIEAKLPFQLIAGNGGSPLGQGLVDDVRTFFSDPLNHFHIPVLEKVK